MNVTILAIDLAKRVFQLHGINTEGKAVLKKRLARSELVEFIAKLPPCLIGMEACGTAHYWGRKFKSLGHEVRLINPAFVKPYVKSNKNDYNDSEAICEAMTRPTMRFVPIKSIGQQDIQSLHRMREQLVCNRTALANQIRGLLSEYGVVFPKEIQNVRKKLPTTLDDIQNELSDFSRGLFKELYEDFVYLDKRIKTCDARIALIFKADKRCQRIGEIPGIGVISATALIAAIGDPKMFKNGRGLSAWIGLVPRQASSGGKNVLLGISKRGDRYLRKLLIHGARSVVLRVKDKEDKMSQWITQLKNRRGMNKTVVAVANKNARMVWALLAKDKDYQQAA
jgi:transposase